MFHQMDCKYYLSNLFEKSSQSLIFFSFLFVCCLFMGRMNWFVTCMNADKNLFDG